MRIDVHHYIHYDPKPAWAEELNTKLENLMSQITEYTARVKTAFETINTGIVGTQKDVDNLKNKIAELLANSTTLSTEDKAALEEIATLSETVAASITNLDNQTADPPA
jgi:uncharacterized coiled-coil DUF342 family protein